MNTLIVGGTSGLGLEMARSIAAQDEHAIITGRHDPRVGFAEFREFDLTGGNLPERIGQFVMKLPAIKSLVYAAGFYQEGHVTDLSDEQVDNMIDVGGRGLIFFVKKLLEKQNSLDELVTITSTSQWTPREYEPIYNFVKAGAGHYSHGQSLDPRIGKTLVVGTSGMNTEFWSKTEKDTSMMMRAEWVAGRIMELRQRDDKYIFAKILGATGELPQRVIVEEPAPVVGPEIVGRLIKSHREKLGMTQVDAANALGISRQWFVAIESGKPTRSNKSDKEWKPRAKTLFRVAKSLDIDVDSLLIAGGYTR